MYLDKFKHTLLCTKQLALIVLVFHHVTINLKNTKIPIVKLIKNNYKKNVYFLKQKN